MSTASPTSKVPDWTSAAANWPRASPVARRLAVRASGPREMRMDPVGTFHLP